MRDILYLAWRYLVFNRWKTGILIAALTVIIFLPLALELVLDRSSERLRSRAADTPLLFGAPGSALELALNSLYFSGESPATLEYAMVDELGDTKLATATPGGGAGSFGLRVQDLTSDLASRLGVEEEHGVVITGVQPGSSAAEAGLRREDVILEIDKNEIADVGDLETHLAEADEGALLLIRRGDATIFVPLKAPKG